MNRPGVLLLAGATASGKSALAVDLARAFDAEIVGADSRQIYRGMPIGTAAPSGAQRAAVPHHLIEFLDPHERYSAARFARDALAAVRAIHARGRRAIVVGGTGFYLRALRGGVTLARAYDADLRARLAREGRIHPPEVLHAWLRARDPQRAAALHPNDRYRVLRALEIALTSAPECEKEAVAALDPHEHALLVLDVPLAVLDARIERRVDAMLAAGLVEEALATGSDAVAANALGYPQVYAYARGWCTAGELRASLVRATRQYARRQEAWFRREPGALRLAPEAVAPFVRENLLWAGKPR